MKELHEEMQSEWPIPEVPEELREPARELVLACLMTKDALVKVMSGEDPAEVFDANEGRLLDAEVTIGRWQEHLGITVQEALEFVGGGEPDVEA